MELSMGPIAKEFRQKSQAIKEYFGQLSQADLASLQAQLAAGPYGPGVPAT